MITIEKARAAKEALKAHLAANGIPASVGLSGNGSEFCLQVRVRAAAADVPTRFEDLEVRVDVIGTAGAE